MEFGGFGGRERREISREEGAKPPSLRSSLADFRILSLGEKGNLDMRIRVWRGKRRIGWRKGGGGVELVGVIPF